jgi:hypothetical protein
VESSSTASHRLPGSRIGRHRQFMWSST